MYLFLFTGSTVPLEWTNPDTGANEVESGAGWGPQTNNRTSRQHHPAVLKVKIQIQIELPPNIRAKINPKS